ncbi:1,6-anhydro-N-acetylmuramyl-L-alanine amidase AmpD [Uliginosibacterium sp. H3]|uniref:1,6-anhydro-N-acetylmuramyl-L-alanine amidase AmpD n=1 Tax=Uliginosibacterium silvisoli TaxID=3114758 RepID=A0ABU6K5P2_9RHOO|nr:1,6-anhydro-N-acetylmuramyl-L-alanine amidase AmpD [Uliginosibacterium sp. H3]
MPALQWIAPLDDDGRIPGAHFVASPNHDERPEGGGVDLVVIHAISLPPDQFGGPGVEQLFTNRLDPDEHPYYASIVQLRVSAHFFIRRDGSLMQFVPTARRAWHAGVSSWQGRERCNDFSIGIELEGSDTLPFRAEQYDCLSRLLLRIRERHPLADICGHSDIAPGRKTDPGPFFEWPRLRALLAAQGAASG